MSEKNINEMSVEELFEESIKQRDIADTAQKTAQEIERKAMESFLAEHNLDGVVLHKPTDIRGILKIERDYTRLEINFYPLKKDGELSKNRNLNCYERWSTYDWKKSVEKYLAVYEPAN